MAADDYTVALSAKEHELLLLMCGYATGAAMKDNQPLAYKFLALTNTLNKGNPNFIPYRIPDEFKTPEEKQDAKD